MKNYIQGGYSRWVAPMAIFALVATSAYAGQPATSLCNPLVTVDNDLVLVDSSGNVVTRFTSDALPKSDAAISPDGRRVAYLSASGPAASAFQVADQSGAHGSFSVISSGVSARGPITGLSWDSDRVVRVTRFAGKDMSRFEFYGIPDALGSQAGSAAPPALEQNCVSGNRENAAACVEREGRVMLGAGTAAKALFSVTGFEGAVASATFTLAAGGSVAPRNGSPFTVTVQDVSNGQVTLRLTPTTGIWSQMQIQSGDYMPEVDYSTGALYGYLATVVDGNAGQVRIDVVKSDSPPNILDPALAWVPSGEGLVFVRRTPSGSMLDLIRPSSAGTGIGGKGKSGWHLDASVPISLPRTVIDIQFMSTTLLLMHFSDGSFGQLPVQMGPGQSAGSSLALGTLTALPRTTAVTMGGASKQAKVSDWSCRAP